MSKRKTRRTRRKFSPEFKAEVLALIDQGDQPITKICQDLDLTESAVRRWVAMRDKQSGKPPSTSPGESDQDELKRLRAENKRLKMERDILKKATVSSTGHCNT